MLSDKKCWELSAPDQFEEAKTCKSLLFQFCSLQISVHVIHAAAFLNSFILICAICGYDLFFRVSNLIFVYLWLTKKLCVSAVIKAFVEIIRVECRLTKKLCVSAVINPHISGNECVLVVKEVCQKLKISLTALSSFITLFFRVVPCVFC